MPQPNPKLRNIDAYTPGEQPQEPGFIKLNTNEFPYPPAPGVVEALKNAATDSIRLYPSPRCSALRQKLAQHHGVSPDQIFVGNGSDEVLRLLIEAYGGPTRSVATVEPSYSLYSNLIQLAASSHQVFPLENLTDLPEAIFETAWDVLLLPVPNPPLGTLFLVEELERLAQNDGLLVLDEAYADFTDEVNNFPLVQSHNNIVITRTFSKAYGLAGLRVGYAVGPAEVITQISNIADSYNVNRMAQVAALAAIEALDYYRAKIELMKQDRLWLSDQLTKRGFRVTPSHANLLFARHPQAMHIYEELKKKRILVRYFSSPLLNDGIRISLGTHEEVMALVEAIDSVLG